MFSWSVLKDFIKFCFTHYYGHMGSTSKRQGHKQEKHFLPFKKKRNIFLGHSSRPFPQQYQYICTSTHQVLAQLNVSLFAWQNGLFFSSYYTCVCACDVFSDGRMVLKFVIMLKKQKLKKSNTYKIKYGRHFYCSTLLISPDIIIIDSLIRVWISI